MLILRSSPASPFVRKVKIAAAILGLQDQMTIADADTMDPNEPLRGQNPLGKIPTLVLEDGERLYDSRVILEYLDHLAGGGRIIPSDGAARFEALRDQALADGIMEGALLQVYEGRFRIEERREPSWMAHQEGKVRRALDHAEVHLSRLGSELHVGHIALACALGYLDLRFQGRWRESYPKLVVWLKAFSDAVPSFEATRAKG
jgi:glutathione S-transferase